MYLSMRRPKKPITKLRPKPSRGGRAAKKRPMTVESPSVGRPGSRRAAARRPKGTIERGPKGRLLLSDVDRELYRDRKDEVDSRKRDEPATSGSDAPP